MNEFKSEMPGTANLVTNASLNAKINVVSILLKTLL